MASKDVMIDIETLSTNVDALVLSIGAAAFDCNAENSPTIDSGILLVPSLYEQLLAGRRIDRDTQLWWGQQDPAAAKHWLEPGAAARTVRIALAELADYIKGADRVWCRGTHFDVAILDSLHQAFGLKSPWKYNAPRDVRSFTEQRDVVRTLTDVGIPLFPAHHPLEDCRVQINDLWQHGLK